MIIFPLCNVPLDAIREPGFCEHQLTCVSGLGANSLRKPLLSWLQTPVRVLFGLDVHRQADPFEFVVTLFSDIL